MVLTGKDALDYSGGVSAENNLGIGGYERIMGPNGQAQYLRPRRRRRLPDPAPALRLHLRRPRRTISRGAPPPPTRSIATCALIPTVVSSPRSANCSASRPTPVARSRSRSGR